MDYKELFLSLDGRIGRGQFWIGTLATLCIALLGSLINPVAGVIAMLAMVYPSVCVSSKRWHDRDKSAWWNLLGLVPIVGGLWSIVECGFLRGSARPNRYGPPLTAGSAGL